MDVGNGNKSSASWVTEISANANLGLLLQRAYLSEDLSESDLSAAEDASDGDVGPRTAPRVQSRQNRNRTKRRRQATATAGHPRRGGNGFLKNVLPSTAVESQLTMEDLPVALGAFVGIDAEFRTFIVATLLFCTFSGYLTRKFKSPHSACPDPSVGFELSAMRFSKSGAAKDAVGEEGVEAAAKD
ncbi:hypothetical protein BDP27DRAFT_1418325 [Rhodocollybia butyracea]|uniref:Uncharacterized protein n=1 Tax=Rhodocollybia butyracea TaxID=206335 RepID=A0A9P5PTQ1_9AGAR|nr:hypothetical protein BDP27DRAFT_1418325 [Rhodocollybia butyracea]